MLQEEPPIMILSEDGTARKHVDDILDQISIESAENFVEIDEDTKETIVTLKITGVLKE